MDVKAFNESGKGYWMEGFGCLRAEGENRPSRPGHVIVLNDQGGDVMNVSDSVTSTLRAQDHGHPPVICYAIEGNVVDRVSAKNGKGWCENVSPTLNTQDRHAVVYTIDALSSNSMKSANPHSGFHETNVSRCLDTSCCEPTCNQGGMVIVVDNHA